MQGTTGFSRKALVWLLTATVIIPLFYFKGMFYPFTASKGFLFRALIEISGALFLILFVLGKIQIRKDFLRKKIIWLPALFLFVGFISGIFGISFSYSLWSSATRLDGLITLAHLIVYFYLLLFIFEKKDWQRFLYAASLASIFVAISGLLEGWGVLNLGPEDGRVGGTINNAAFLASYLIFTLPLLTYQALLEPKNTKLFYVFSGGAIISLLAIFTTGTRGALVGLIFATIALLATLAWNTSEKRIKKRSLGVLLAAVIIIGIGFTFRDTLKKSNILVLRRVASVSLTDATTQNRLFVWKNTLPIFLERPVLGFGMENFEYIYNKFYDPSVLTEEWFDRSHNTYLDALIHGGVVGFIVYMALYGTMGYLIFGLRKKDPRAFYSFSFLFIAYAVQNFFVFDSLNTQFIFYAFFAYLIHRSAEDEAPAYTSFAQLENGKGAIPAKIVGFALAVACAGSMYWFVWLPLQANLLLVEGYKYQIVEPTRSLALWRKGLLVGSSYDMDYGYQAYDSYFNKKAEKISGVDIQKAYEYSVELLKDLITRYPWNARLYVYLAHIYEDRPEGVLLSEEEFKKIIEKARELSPKRKQPHYILANIYFSRVVHSPYLPSEAKDFEEGLSVLRSYTKEVPSFAEPHILLANLLRQNGKDDEAAKEFSEGIRLYKPELGLARRVITYYLAKKDYKNVEPYLLYVVHEEPTNMDFLFDLAHIYYLNGKIEEARVAVQKIAQINKKILESDPSFVGVLFPNGVTSAE